MDKKLVRISKFMTLVLRHRPEFIDVELEDEGWLSIDLLIKNAQEKGVAITRESLDQVVEKNDKNRFEIKGDKIRARQGHSVKTDIAFEKKYPPASLYHGTIQDNVESIMRLGLHKRKRHHVHLSPDEETASKVGGRRGKAVVLKLDSKKMVEDGHIFYLSTNNVWLVEHVPPEYIEAIE